MRNSAMREAREAMRASYRRTGLLRHTRQERMELAARDIAAIATVLDEKPFLMGDAPSAIDGAGFGVIESARAPVFDTPLIALVQRHDNLMRYLDRMKHCFFDRSRWPAQSDTLIS